MNLLTSKRFISFIWWIAVPILVAKVAVSLVILFLDDGVGDFEVDSEQKRVLYKFPNFFTTKTIQKVQIPTKKTEKFIGIELKGCYVSKGKEFIVVSDARKTVFLDLNATYKGAKLIKVTRDSALFSKDGEHILLVLDKKSLKKSPTQAKIAPSYRAGEQNFIEVSRDNFKIYEQNPKKALSDIRFYEFKEGGKFQGIKLSYVRRGAFFAKLGLKKGDIIYSINGNALKSAMDLLPYYTKLNETTSLTIGLKRGNEFKEIIYEIN